jgi:hypothetical protein
VIDVPGVNISMPESFTATTPGRWEMPTTVQVTETNEIVGELSDDQLPLEAALAEQRALHEMLLSFLDAHEARSKQVHAVVMARLGIPLGFAKVEGAPRFLEVSRP